MLLKQFEENILKLLKPLLLGVYKYQSILGEKSMILLADKDEKLSNSF